MHWDVTVCAKAVYLFIFFLWLRLTREYTGIATQPRVVPIPKGLHWPRPSLQTSARAKYSRNMIRLSWMLGCYDIPALMRMSITQTVMDFLITVLSCGICHPKFFHLAPVLLKLNCVLSCKKKTNKKKPQKNMRNENTRGQVWIFVAP